MAIKQRRGEAGMTLLEVLGSAALMALIGVAIVSLLATALRLGRLGWSRGEETRDLQLAQMRMVLVARGARDFTVRDLANNGMNDPDFNPVPAGGCLESEQDWATMSRQSDQWLVEMDREVYDSFSRQWISRPIKWGVAVKRDAAGNLVSKELRQVDSISGITPTTGLLLAANVEMACFVKSGRGLTVTLALKSDGREVRQWSFVTYSRNG